MEVEGLLAAEAAFEFDPHSCPLLMDRERNGGASHLRVGHAVALFGIEPVIVETSKLFVGLGELLSKAVDVEGACHSLGLLLETLRLGHQFLDPFILVREARVHRHLQ